MGMKQRGYFDTGFYPYSTTARMQKVEQRMEQLPRPINLALASYVTIDTNAEDG
jgi:hypothetical protein